MKCHCTDVALALQRVTINTNLDAIILVLFSQQTAQRNEKVRSAVSWRGIDVASVVGPPIVANIRLRLFSCTKASLYFAADQMNEKRVAPLVSGLLFRLCKLCNARLILEQGIELCR